MLIMSAAPSTTRTAIENQKDVDSPNAMVATPNTPTAVNMMRPTLRSTGNRASHNDIISAPTAGAERNMPRPHGPVSRMSLANTGKSAVARPGDGG